MSKKHFSCDKEVIGSDKDGYYCPHCNVDLTDRDVLPMIVFDKITESPETLAEKLVYQNYIGLWCSPFIQWGKDTKAEAFAATVAKLKEVAKDDR